MAGGSEVLSLEDVAAVVARAVTEEAEVERDLGRQELAVLGESEVLVRDVGELILAAVDVAYDLGRGARTEAVRP